MRFTEVERGEKAFRFIHLFGDLEVKTFCALSEGLRVTEIEKIKEDERKEKKDVFVFLKKIVHKIIAGGGVDRNSDSGRE